MKRLLLFTYIYCLAYVLMVLNAIAYCTEHLGFLVIRSMGKAIDYAEGKKNEVA